MSAIDEEALLAKLANQPSYVMTQAEASHVWGEYNRLMRGNRKLQVLSLLNERLVRETNKGSRCSVCGRADDPRCTYEC